jgi:Family of unknown function (DUF6152)
MRTQRFGFAATLVLLFAAMPVLAHHALVAEYDTNKTVTLTGTVTNVDWSNPHAHMSIDTEEANGTTKAWNLQLASPNLLILHGWKIDTVRKGDHVEVSVYVARDGSNHAYATKVAVKSR